MRPLTARTDSSRTPGSERRGDAGKRAQRFVYDWDEVGQLMRARRWDYAGNTIPAGEPVFPAVPTQAPDRDLRYAYSMGSRVLKSVADETSAETHTLEVFASLRVERTQLLGDDYELDENTEKVYLAGVGRLVHDPALPSWSGDPKHVLLTMSDHLGSAAFVLDRDSGEVVEKITHQAYGEVESDYRPTRWKSQREVYRFTGKEDDFEVGLTYFGARYFHTRLGRWISPDPLTIHAGAADPNPYAYVGGRVSTATDPHGLCSEDDASDCIGGAYWADTHQPWVSVGDDYWQPQFGDGGLIGHTYREWIAEGRPSWTSSPEPVGPEIGPLSTPASAIGTAGQAAGSAGGWVNTYNETPISTSRSDYLAEKHPRLASSIRGARNQELVIEYAPWLLSLLPGQRAVIAEEALLAGAGRRGVAAAPGAAGRADGGRRVLLDSNVVAELQKDPTLGGRLVAGEQPVVSYVTGAELRNAVAKGGGLRGVPRALGDLPVLETRPSLDRRIDFRGSLSRRTGRFGDGIIGAQATEFGLPLITNDVELAGAVARSGGTVR